MAKQEAPAQERENPDLYATAGTSDKSSERTEIVGMEQFPVYGTDALEIEKPIRGVYLGSQARGKNREGRPYMIQVFQNPKSGDKFAFWDTAGLASRLLNVAPGTTVDVSYHGKEQHPTDSEKTLHQFKVFAIKSK